MTTSQTPYAQEGSSMASTAKTDSTSSPSTETAPAASHVVLAPAGQSGDPAVQKLLADREGHRMALEPDPDHTARREAAQKAIDAVDAELEKLGFTAK